MDIVERLMQQIETGPDVEDIAFINPDGPDAVDEIERLEDEIERLREALQRIVEVTDYGTKTSTTMSGFAVNNANIIARSALQQKESE